MYICASMNDKFREQMLWLIVNCNPEENEEVIQILRTLKLSLLSDLVFARSTIEQSSNDDEDVFEESFVCPVVLPERENLPSNHFSKYVKIHEQPSKISQNSISLEGMPYSNKSLNATDEEDTTPYYELTQIYKIRKDLSNSVIINKLGSWNPATKFANTSEFLQVDSRQDFMGFPIVVGRKNWTSIKKNSLYINNKTKVYNTEVDDTDNLNQIMKFIAQYLNATIKYVEIESLGQDSENGIWSEFLQAVVNEKVDIGLELVTVTYEKLNDMLFTHTIMKASYSIYMHPSDSSVSQDIYLTPFSPKLLLCVLAMAILLAILMIIVSAVANYRAKKKNQETQPISVSFAVLWIVGVLSMQGSIWTPVSSAGNMTLILSLMFALIIYNSYAAFITSILSVKTSDIKSLEDLFTNGYTVGYIQNSPEELFLKKQTGELKTFYHESANSKVENIDQGLLLAANTKYALFTSTQAGRRVISYLTPYTSRCEIQEFPLRYTQVDMAFPMPISSPYYKLINIGLMRLIESGSLTRLRENMVPNMPTCSSDSSFVSAQLEDVLTAVKLLGAGIITAIVVLIFEYIFKLKKHKRIKLKKIMFKKN